MSDDILIEFVKRNAGWLLRFLVVYLGNPIIFLSFMFSFMGASGDDGKKIFGMRTFVWTSINVYRLNAFLYLLLTLPLYCAWFWAQLQLLPLCPSRRTFDPDMFCQLYTFQTNWCLFLWTVPGIYNLMLWTIGDGMEGNAFGFLLALPMLIVSVAYIVMWIATVSRSFHAADNNEYLLPEEQPF